MKTKIKLLTIFLVLSMAILVVGCLTQTIEDIRNEDHVGKTVAVKGEVQSTMKIGQLSGYLIEDSNGDNIPVSSESLPAEGDSMVVRGTLMKDTLFGYYILVD